MNKDFIAVGKTVFVAVTEQIWDKPYPMKRSDIYSYRTVIIKCQVEDIKGFQFKAKLFDNNGFENDGGVFVFEINQLLLDQDYKDVASLGKWRKHE